MLVRFGTVIKVVVTVGAMTLIAAKVDIGNAFAKAKLSDANTLLLALGFLSLQPILGTFRWKLLLSAQAVPVDIKLVTRWTYIATFFSQILPATVGADMIRSFLCVKAGFGWKAGLSSVALDRVAMLFTLMVMVAIVAPWLDTFIPAAKAAAPIMLAACAIGIGALVLAQRLPKAWDRFEIVHFVRFVGGQSRSLVVRPRYAVAIFALCFLSYANIIVSLYLCATAFHASAALSDFFVLIPPVLIASTLPISIGGWGPRELAMVGTLALAGIPAETAILVSVWLGLASIVVSLPGAVLYLINRTTRST